MKRHSNMSREVGCLALFATSKEQEPLNNKKCPWIGIDEDKFFVSITIYTYLERGPEYIEIKFAK